MLARLLAWQAALQIISLVAGFALLRWLDVEAYAQYTLAYGFVAALTLLIDLGFGQAVVALVGERADDDTVIKTYIASARRLRNRMILGLVPAAGVVFALMTAGKGWSWETRVGLYLSVALTIVARSFQEFYGLRLIIQQHHGAYMRPQVGASVVRLVALVVARSVGVLTSVLASVLSSLMAILPAAYYRRRTGRLPACGDAAHEREIVSYALPLAPMLLYSAFQSQLPIFAVATFGSVRAIAEVGALSRLGQLFALVAIVNAMVILPKAARATRAQLPGLLVPSIGGASAFAAGIAACAFVLPEPFILLLGSEYESLSDDVGFYLLGAGLTFVSGVIFTITAARGYVYWWLTGTLIGGVFAVQAFVATTIDLSHVPGIVLFLIVTGTTQLLIASAGLVYGLVKGPRSSWRADESISVPLDGGP